PQKKPGAFEGSSQPWQSPIQSTWHNSKLALSHDVALKSWPTLFKGEVSTYRIGIYTNLF
ncbi:MAG: hypothetical protein ACRD19_04965, partial [Terriglobia bacterium]